MGGDRSMKLPQLNITKHKKIIGIAGGVAFIVLIFVVYALEKVMNNEPVIPGQSSLVNQYANSKYGTGLPPGSVGLVGKETDPKATPETTGEIKIGKFGEDPAALEKRIPVTVMGVLTGYPKQRGAAYDEFYGYIIPESGSYKNNEMTIDFHKYKIMYDKKAEKQKQFMGDRVEVKGEIYRQFVDPKKPTKVQYVVLVDTIEFATKSAEKK